MRHLAAFLLLLLASATFAAEPKVHRDLAYAEPKNERQTLDVYAPPQGKNLPVVLWIHGGGWRRGDKVDVHNFTVSLKCVDQSDEGASACVTASGRGGPARCA